ncbi:MAG: pimeloyl-CoA dehydrogenase large subunit, partial [Pseudomonadota bacterium]
EQAINEMMVEVLGYYAVPFVSGLDDAHSNERIGPDAADGVVAEHLLRRSASIFGGTNEIQKNIIAKMVLGL